MRSRRPRLLMLGTFTSIAVAAAVVGCSSFSADDVSPSNEASAPDAPSEGMVSTADAAAPDVAPPDAVDASCLEEFHLDEPFSSTASLASWQLNENGGVIGVTKTLPNNLAPTSSPGALYASGTLPDSGATGLTASISRSIAFVPTTLEVRYALYVPASTAYAQVGCALYFGGNSPARIDTFLFGTQLRTRRTTIDGGNMPDYLLAATPTSDWIEISASVVTDASAHTMHPVMSAYTVTGSLIGTVVLEATQLPPDASGVRFECGVPYADSGGATATGTDTIQLAIDDLKIDACRR